MRLKHLLWLPPVLALLLIDPGIIPTPHLRFAGTYSSTSADPYFHHCDYVGLHSRRISPPDGRCPIIAFLTSF
ncbi:hypothetical protein [Pyruvatibacter mobilis]|uniref:hypothetical protein n=1 Tax=Pyruvatibacter mobilis TaxID=1712261 RepID=UPI003BAEE87C